MKPIKAFSLAAVTLGALASTAEPIDFTKYGDLEFAEKYAYSTNRPGLIATLKRQTAPWFFYSLLNLQVDGQYAAAKDFVNKCRTGDSAVDGAWNALRLRQEFLDWEAARGRPRPGGRTPDEFLAWGLTSCGIKSAKYVRETTVRPNTYPSELDQRRISFKAVCKEQIYHSMDCFEDRFRFLAFTDAVKRPDFFDRWKPYTPETPGFYEALLGWVASAAVDKVDFNEAAFKCLTLKQLAALRHELCDVRGKKELIENDSFIRLVLSKLQAGPEEDVAGDADAKRAVFDRELEFLRTLPESKRALAVGKIRQILELERSRGSFAEKELFLEYVKATLANRERKNLPAPGDLEKAYLAAFRRAGSELKEFEPWFAANALAKVRAECDLRSGVDPAKVEVAALREHEYRELVDRVELVWCADNPVRFAADAEVSLAIDVKNVPKMRLAIYELDAYAAAVKLGSEVKSDLDLDGCVPSVDRTFDFSRTPSVVSHRETLKLPELSKSGVYVVECSGAGLSSRALVRKGTLRVASRIGAGGLVFTALDENGEVVRDAQLRLGVTAFSADERGEIAVPFAVPKEAGMKTAVIGNRSLAVTHRFLLPPESYSLELSGALPAEGVVAGMEAKAVLRPRLSVCGTPVSLGLVEQPVLTLTFVDRDYVETVRSLGEVKLEDDAELDVPFVAPSNLRSVAFCLSGKVRNVSADKDEAVCATYSSGFNGLCDGERIAQALLRRGAEGYSLELRGRNGEPLAAREVKLEFKHLVFKQPHGETLQTDANGTIRLGALADIAELRLVAPFAQSWTLADETTRTLPSLLTAVEGESVEFAVRGLADGAWPMADDLRARVSLVAKNAAGEITADCLEAVSYKDGLLRIERLVAGDYTLTLRAEKKSVDIKVTRTSAKKIAGGLVVGAHRGLPDTGSPSRMRIAAAAIGADGTLSVRLANAGEGARVHLVARRFVPDSAAEPGIYEMLTGRQTPTDPVRNWSAPRVDYVSGRDLGDRLRYILDRRNLPHRPGIMLDRPSLLLNPWSVSETVTRENQVRDGSGWAPAAEAAAERAHAPMAMAADAAMSESAVLDTTTPYLDFLASGAKTWCNLRPDAAGTVTLRLPALAAFQDLDVIAVDGAGADRVRLVGKTAPLALRDMRHFAAKAGENVAPRSKTYETVGELWRMLAGDEAAYVDFGFVADWGSLADGVRRELYGKYASHELDLFLYFKDRPFFDAVVAPNLRNKRFRQFTDKWLLGEDLSAYAEPGALQDLNALERCLLAKRVPAMAKVVADALGSEAAAHPVSPSDVDRLLAKALGIADCVEAQGGAMMEVEESEAEDDEGWRPVYGLMSGRKMKSLAGSRNAAASRSNMIADDLELADAGWSNQRVVLSEDKAKDMKQRVMRRSPAEVGRATAAADRERRGKRQLYRPPERTREWIETHHYKLPHAVDGKTLVRNSPFWAAYAKAIAEGKDAEFRTADVMFAGGSLTSTLGALAVLDLPLAKGDGKRSVVFTERRVDETQRGERDLGIVQRFFDPLAPVEDAEHGGVRYDYTVDEFVAGRTYALSTVLSNPTDRELPTRLRVRVPDGAIALGCVPADRTFAFDVKDRSMVSTVTKFYFPTAEGGVGALAPAVASVDGRLRGIGEAKRCNVVAAATKEDRTSWHWISQNGTADEVLGFLATANLASDSVDLGLMGWRMGDAGFARKAFAALSARGVFHAGLWSTALAGRSGITDNERRVRELLMTRENRTRLAPKLGPSFSCSLVEIDPEADDLYEHKEYWPLINARAHALGGKATIPNESLKRQYRAFLDVLATHRELTAKDRLDAAVYLIAQDRVDEAETMAASVVAKDVDTKMQLDYLRAYFAFARLKPEEGRRIAAAYADYPVARWRERFRKVIAQADEIAGKGAAAAGNAADDIAAAPSLELAHGEGETLALRTRNVKRVLVKAFPTDVEVTFSKDPFGGDTVKSASSFLKPAWTQTVTPDGRGAATVKLPESLRGVNLIVEATDGEERVAATMTVLSGALDVQAVKEYGELRVRDGAGKPLAAAYVKVYARDASGMVVKFHKDGYTDLRGAFDYAGVSTDSEFRPAEFAILVLHDRAGVKTLTVPWSGAGPDTK